MIVRVSFFIWYTQGSFGPQFIYFMLYLKNDPNNFILVLKENYVKKISRGGWSGFGMETVGIHPNDFGVLNGHPNKIPTNEMLGDVVKNCRKAVLLESVPTEIPIKSNPLIAFEHLSHNFQTHYMH